VPRIAVAGLALSIGLGACVNALFLFWGLRRRGIYHAHKGWGRFLLKLAVALCAMGAIALLLGGRIDWIAMRAHPVLRLLALLGIVGVCAAGYFAALFAMGVRMRDFKRSAH
jgi:putative peptidoglycan lipid II flippase